ncbi:Chemotaxis protein, CheW/CheV-like [Desulfonema limicola]|uniref:Chemotaxis protein, CheW/CheV-like n=1 Tax=Desulfonema limicola TaxID=45656 RepID=A0A975B3D7_9BACT|nr:chemotaxis protein CheW [Desulfonema limicola]QTA78031.1 Chemotaxis protein, CheW/CheV-like [Desulfonema limicola]
MLSLLFYLGETIYTISCEKVREIVPLMALKKVPNEADYFAGFFNYRGEIVPVIDLCMLIQKQPCKMRLSTRIILAEYSGKNLKPYLLGLIAERVTETIRRPEESFVSTIVNLENAPYLRGILMEDNQMIQNIDLELLPDAIGFLSSIHTSLKPLP